MDNDTIESVFGQTKPSVRDQITRQTIGNRTVIVVRKGKSMGKRGAKRKEGLREPNGRLDRRTQAQRLNDLNQADNRRIKSVVLLQPHRQGRDEPWVASALGRFCIHAGCNPDVFNGVEAYAKDKIRWSIAVGKPKGFENVTLGGSTDGPTPEQVARWKERFTKVHIAIVEQYGAFIMSQMHRLAVEDMDLRLDTMEQNTPAIRSAMGEVAVIMGMLERNPHPFRASPHSRT